MTKDELLKLCDDWSGKTPPGFDRTKLAPGVAVLLRDAEAMARALKSLLTDQSTAGRTPGTVEVCEICNRPVDQFADDGCGYVADPDEDDGEPGYEDCPLTPAPPQEPRR
jgi:hypothetical protein